ncbi:MAG: peptidoglycan DD-metalloendopeptidase family protein [Proteobacteria bacterium]|nr:peptidoglycan DD-metalloendopeptidase family protein [Pseudomonadota bacterium]
MSAGGGTTHAWLGRWLALFALVVLLGACGESHVVRRAPEARGSVRAVQPLPHRTGADEVVVVRGDTLYGVAFRNGMDFRELAAINGIGPPYTIYVGQVLRLRGAHAGPTRTLAPTASTPVREPPPVRSPPPSSESGPPVAPSTPAMATSPQHPQPAPNAHAEEVSPSTPSAAILPADTTTVGGIRWRWPASGALLERFAPGDATKQGIDIAGHAGDPVLAASDGVVVYSGSGLVGYGELVIIKHSDEWLSAYGHNRKRLVSEGQRVRAGQPIAEMGSTGATRDELHFEIRRNGRPVDPLQYLPAR